MARLSTKHVRTYYQIKLSCLTDQEFALRCRAVPANYPFGFASYSRWRI